MASEVWSWSQNYTIPSRTGAGMRVLEELLAQLAHHQWSDHDVFGVHLSAEEALVNAIKHGNKYDESKIVRVQCQVSRDKIRIEIIDQGKGFDPDAVPDCTLDENLEVCSGRGVMLIRSFMTQVDYLDRGTRVVMEKHRSAEAVAEE